MNHPKPALSFAEQLHRLKQRGMIVPDDGLALRCSRMLNYHRLSAYWRIFTLDGSGNFRPGTEFEEVIRLYEFDRDLRGLVLQALEPAEIHFRTLFAYRMAHEFGPLGYMRRDNFNMRFRSGRHGRWLRRLETEIKRSSSHLAVECQSQCGFPAMPITMAVEMMTLGSLWRGYEGSKWEAIKKPMAGEYGTNHQVLLSWLRGLNKVRNICAHCQRLWNHPIGVSMKAPDGEKHLLEQFDRARIGYALWVLHRMLAHVDRDECLKWHDRCVALLQPMGKWHRRMGILHDDWRSSCRLAMEVR